MGILYDAVTRLERKKPKESREEREPKNGFKLI